MPPGSPLIPNMGAECAITTDKANKQRKTPITVPHEKITLYPFDTSRLKTVKIFLAILLVLKHELSYNPLSNAELKFSSRDHHLFFEHFMTYFFSRVFTCILLIFPLSGISGEKISNRLFKIKSITDVHEYLTKQALVIFGIDNTIFESQTPYGHANWFYSQIHEGEKFGLMEQEIINKIYPQWIESQKNNHVNMVETHTAKVIQDLQSQGFQLMALTRRQIPMMQVTLNQLRGLGIDFSKKPLYPQTHFLPFKSPALYSQGILFASDFNKKGVVLREFLKEIDHHPTRIVCIDDDLGTLQSLVRYLSAAGVDIVGLYYPLVEERNTIWDHRAAEDAYFQQLISKPHLTPHFLEKKSLLSKQKFLLKKNKSILNPYRYRLLGKEFVGYPGVFSPQVFGSDGFFASQIPVSQSSRVLEIGPGTGSMSVMSALKGVKKMVAVDINPIAIANTKANAEMHRVHDIVDVRSGNLFSPIQPQERFDIIYFDIPFNHTEKFPLSLLEQAIFDPDYKLLKRFLSQAQHYLSHKGRVYLGYSSTHGNYSYLQFLAKHYGWSMKVIAEQGDETTIKLELIEMAYRP